MIVISQNFYLAPGVMPLTHARIGWQTFTRDVTATVSSAAAGFPALALRNSLTYEHWQASSMPATAAWDAGVARDVDYLGIASHTIGSSAATVAVEYSTNGVDWTVVAETTPADDEPLMFIFGVVTARYWRIRLTGSTAPFIGAVYIGKLLEMMRPIYGGHTPINLSRDTVIRPQISQAGQWLGRAIVRKGLSTTASWKHLDANWYRTYFDPFVESAREYPFFFAWRPADHPDEVAYCWVGGDIAPSNMGIRNLMEVSVTMEGYGGY